MTSKKRYFPGLIPDEHRVLKDYFQAASDLRSETTSGWQSASITAAILLLTFSFFTTAYIPFFLMLILTGFLLFPKINKSLARTYRFKWTPRARSFSIAVLLLVNVPFAINFGIAENRLAIEHQLLVKKQEKFIELLELKEHNRIDSLAVYNQRLKSFQAQGKLDEALLEINRIDQLVITDDEINSAKQQRFEISLLKVDALMKTKQYPQAIDLLTDLQTFDSNNAEILFQRAVCYAKVNRTEEAVQDAKQAMSYGYQPAEELYEKLNPIRKRVAYYTTLCNDGSFSGATGRGACSHHGGVASWNYPVYEEYRKYE
jgi:tetratricopeptide (TPR) repeat protein